MDVVSGQIVKKKKKTRADSWLLVKKFHDI